MSRSVSPCRQRMLSTLRPFYDFRGLSLLALCAVIGLMTDPAATLGLAGYLAYVIQFWPRRRSAGQWRRGGRCPGR